MRADFERALDTWVGDIPERALLKVELKSGDGGDPPRTSKKLQDCLRREAQLGYPFPEDWVTSVYQAYHGKGQGDFDDDNPMWDTLSRQIPSP